MLRAMITGGAGFIGSNLVRRLQDEHPDARLLVIDDLRTGTFANLCDDSPDGWSYGGQLVARSLGSLNLDDLVDQFDPQIIFHEASITDTTIIDEARMVVENVEPFKKLLEIAVARGLKLVWASSAATYGRLANGATAERRPFRLEDAGHPANAYGISKLLMENLHRQMLEEHPEAHVVALRYFNVFGAGERNKKHMASMVFQLAEQMLSGKQPRIFRDGEQARDQVPVEDVVDATLAAAGDGARSGIYNVGSGQTTTYNQIICALNQALGTRYEPQYFDNPYPFYQDYTCADLSQTRDGLGWSSKAPPQESIIAYGRWLQKRFGVPSRE